MDCAAKSRALIGKQWLAVVLHLLWSSVTHKNSSLRDFSLAAPRISASFENACKRERDSCTKEQRLLRTEQMR
eukprot:2263309-Amphidinium_carterae.1